MPQISSFQITLVAVLSVGSLIVFGNALTFILDMSATDRGLEFVFLRSLRFCTVKFENVELVKKGGGGFQYFVAYNFQNRPLKPTFYLKLRKGWFARKLLVTPADGEAFVSTLKKHGVRVE